MHHKMSKLRMTLLCCRPKTQLLCCKTEWNEHYRQMWFCIRDVLSRKNAWVPVALAEDLIDSKKRQNKYSRLCSLWKDGNKIRGGNRMFIRCRKDRDPSRISSRFVCKSQLQYTQLLDLTFYSNFKTELLLQAVKPDLSAYLQNVPIRLYFDWKADFHQPDGIFIIIISICHQIFMILNFIVTV